MDDDEEFCYASDDSTEKKEEKEDAVPASPPTPLASSDRPSLECVSGNGEAQAWECVEKLVLKTASLCGVSPETSCLLLISNHWDAQAAAQMWFDDATLIAFIRSNGAAADVTLQPFVGALIASKPAEECGVCLEAGAPDMFRLHCGHAFCSGCWRNGLRACQEKGREDGGGVSPTMTCPGCTAVVSPWPPALSALAWPEIASKAQTALMSTYLPAAGLVICPQCKTLVHHSKSGAAACKCPACNLQFCGKCTRDCHEPIACKTVDAWLQEHTALDESAEAYWEMFNAKNCPGCHRRINRNGGCNHMTCPCGTEFCWMCLCPWKSHGGSFYECAAYQTELLQKPELQLMREAQEKAEADQRRFDADWARHRTFMEACAKMDELMAFAESCLTSPDAAVVARGVILKVAVNITKRGRRFLAWLVAGRYFIRDTHAVVLATRLLIDLERSTDSLQFEIERVISPDGLMSVGVLRGFITALETSFDGASLRAQSMFGV